MPASPADGATLPGGATARVDLGWNVVEGAEGYLLEVEEAVGDGWSPLVRRVVREASAALEVEPASGGATTLRWRVRSVVGRKGGRACPWSTVRVGA